MNERLTLQDLIDLLAKRQEITKKDAETFLRELIAVITENIEKNEIVRIKDFGTFKLVLVSSRKSVDVNTGEPIEIPPHYKLSFAPEKNLREAVNRPFAHFESVLIEDGADFSEVKQEFSLDQPDLENQNLIETENIIDGDENDNELPPPIPSSVEDSVNEDTPPPIPFSEISKTEIIIEPDPNNEIADDEQIPAIPSVIIQNDAVMQKKDESLISKDEEKDKSSAPKEVEGTKSHKTIANAKTDTKKITDKTLNDIHTTKYHYKSGDKDSPKYIKNRYNLNKYIYWGIVFIFGIVIIYFGFKFYQKNWHEAPTISYDQNNSQIRIYDEKDTTQIEDTTSNSASIEEKVTQEQLVVDNTLKAIEVKLKTPKAEKDDSTVIAKGQLPKGKSAKDEKAESAKKTTAAPKKIILRQGNTLRSLGLEYYGNKSFWVYIYEENKNIITNPNNIPLGTELKIAPPEKYGIDANNKASLQKAREFESALFSKMK